MTPEKQKSQNNDSFFVFCFVRRQELISLCRKLPDTYCASILFFNIYFYHRYTFVLECLIKLVNIHEDLAMTITFLMN